MAGFDTAALRQAADEPWPEDRRTQLRLWVQNASDLSAAADYIDELEAKIVELTEDPVPVWIDEVEA